MESVFYNQSLLASPTLKIWKFPVIFHSKAFITLSLSKVAKL